ncbi:hypothetical protein LWI28_013577 [Acer negundo]|uniref:Separase-like TPR repeats region domain-containing protein n=1 Tax=Acer negundo TaxID=4023 RepID=A0AAD5NJL1_ACENE|nr:hypothetical protein LWI28_013577 [Acer negundo]
MASDILHRLEFSDNLGSTMQRLMNSYLIPLLLASDINKQNQNTLRKHATTYLNFLTKSICIIPRRLFSQLTKDTTEQQQQLTNDLFGTYILFLCCFDLLSPHLSSMSYEDVENERFRVLNNLRRFDLDRKSYDSMLARVFLDAMSHMVKCVALWQKKDDGVYWKMIGLIKEASCCFRVLVLLRSGFRFKYQSSP